MRSGLLNSTNACSALSRRFNCLPRLVLAGGFITLHPLHSIARFYFVPALVRAPRPCTTRANRLLCARQPTAAIEHDTGHTTHAYGSCRCNPTRHTRSGLLPVYLQLFGWRGCCSYTLHTRRHVANQPLKQTCIMDSDSGRKNTQSNLYVHPSIHPNAISHAFWQKKLGRGGDVQLTALDHVAPWAIRRVSDHWEAAVVPTYSSCQLP